MQDLKVLILGAGVAGLTCAGLLRRQGIAPTLVEKVSREEFNRSGYMLGLLPLGGRVLNALDLREDYFERSIQMERYEIHHQNGELVKAYPLDFIHEQFGSYRGISRTELIDLLLAANDREAIHYERVATGFSEAENGVEVAFSDESLEWFDLVIAADGLHSNNRNLLLNPAELDRHDTGWGGWVTWLEEPGEPVYAECWGPGSFLGLYPVKGRVGVFLGGPVSEIRKLGAAGFAAIEQEKLVSRHSGFHKALAAFQRAGDPYFWEFHDRRSSTWRKGRVVLLGDAATGFLPTAGVGASMAMDSAAALADELGRADRDHIDYALRLYEHRQMDRSRRAQEDSRKLGKLMFLENPLLAHLRDWMLPFYSLERMLSDITDVMEGD